MDDVSEIPVWIEVKSFAPHKKMFGSSFPSFGQITTSSAKGITGLVTVVPKLTTLKTWVIDWQGATASL